MNLINEIFSGAWNQALVWTLIHSLWQGGVVLIILITALRFIPSRFSSVRYLVASGALALFMFSSVFTYLLLSGTTPEVLQISTWESPTAVTVTAQQAVTHQSTTTAFVSGLYGFVESYSYLITIAWMVGALVFSLRMVSGFLYVATIRKNAVALGEEWTLLLEQLTKRIALNKCVVLAESHNIKVPFVAGFFRPVILLPVGMMSGLTTQELESILVHELMHIKRNDYTVNVIQSIVESIFFFNPFVWVISSLIRSEREHCCDDEVVKHGDALSYAYALTRIEELNLRHVSPALSLAENKNQLLKRIRRIMEKSVQNYSVKERIVPVVLLIVGLVCASWFSIRPAKSVGSEESPLTMASDTTKPKETTKTYSKRRITKTDREGNLIETLEVEGDLELDRTFDFSFDYSFDMPPVPEPFEPMEPLVPMEPMIPMTPFAPVPDMLPMTPPTPMHPREPFGADMAWAPRFSFEMDTIPGSVFRSDEDWEAFSEDFQLKFKEKFADFYKKHGEEMDKMMKELGENFKTSFDKGMLEELQREAERAHDFSGHHMRAAREAMQRDHQFQEEQAAMAEQRAHHAQNLAHEHQEMLKDHQKQLKRHQEELQAQQEKMSKFNKELKAELIKDGYLDKDERIRNIHWKDDEKIEINRKEIKQEHRKKYDELYRKYFQRGGSFIYVD